MRKTVVVVLLGMSGFFYWQHRESAKNDGFCIQRIESRIPNSAEWELAQNPPSVAGLFGQPFYYLGRGLQFYAFESADGKYVLKFLRHQRLRPNVLIQGLPWLGPYKERECQKRIGYIFRSLKVAFQDVPEETGLLCVHLNKTKNLYGNVCIHDKLHNSYQVALDDTEFVLQQKAELVKPTLTKLMQQGRVEEAQRRIEEIFFLLKSCAKKGVCDTDGQLIRKNNLGFLDKRAIYIDTGKLTRKASIKTKARFVQDLERLEPLSLWLSEQYPELADHFNKVQQTIINDF